MRPVRTIGNLRHRVTVRKTTPTTDSYGNVTDVWADVETVFAKITPLTGSEWLRADKTVASVSHKVTMRYRNDLGTADLTVAPKYQLRYNSRDFEIVRVIDVDERHRWLDILASEVVA